MSLDVEWKDADYSVELDKSSNELKDSIVGYVGNKLKPENDEVTVAMIVEVLASEFPEVVFSLAEENWVRGYEQGLEDIKNFEEE